MLRTEEKIDANIYLFFVGRIVFGKWMNKQRYGKMLSVGLKIEPHLLRLLMLLLFFRNFVWRPFFLNAHTPFIL